jgi:TatD DNase family protein
MNTYAYEFKDSLYLNITNKCMMACPYCMKNKWKGQFHDSDLRLDHDPSVDEVMGAISDISKYTEIVFCGYGDALMRPEATCEIARRLKEQGAKTRINTAGLANKFWDRNICTELEGLIDAISISLNGATPRQHNEINHPKFGEESFEAILSFTRLAKLSIPSVTITAVDFPYLDVSKVKDIADSLGVNFRVRKYEE